ncbi:MAG: peroxiredoxin [Pseudomonadota bacterium]
MKLNVGDRLPEADMSVMGPERPEQSKLSAHLDGRKVVLFGLPGAYTGTCSTTHIPSFMAVIDELKAKGIDDVYCISVNDAHVLKAWGEASGATAAGIKFLGDPGAEFTKAIGADFTVPAIGFYNRSNRYAALVDNGVVTVLSVDEPGVCDVTTGTRFLEQL